MSFRMWYLRHFDKDKLLEELSKPVEGEYIVIKEGNMLTTLKKEELDSYIKSLKYTSEYYMERYERARKEYEKYGPLHQ